MSVFRLRIFSHLPRPRVVFGFVLAGLSVAISSLPVMAHGTFDARLAVLNEKLSRQPEDATLHFNLAELYCEHEEPLKALTELEQVKALAPGKLPVDYLTGMCLRQAGQPAEALVALNRFVTVNPDNSLARLQRARVHAALGNISDGLDDYRAALRLSLRVEPDLVQETADALAASGHSDEAVQVLDAGLVTLGPIPSLTLRALELETATGRFDAALIRVDILQKAAPRPEPWMAKRAAVLAQAGRNAEARVVWTALIAHLAALPNLERGSHSMSVLAEQAQRALAASDEPLAMRSAAAKRDVPSVTALFPSRSSLGEGSRYEEELDRLDRMIEKAPADAGLRFRRAYLLLLDGKWNEAQANCDEADRLAPGQYSTDRIRGQLLAAEGKLAESRTLLDEFLGVHTDDGLAYAARARVLLQLKQADAALADFRAALKFTPNTDANLYQEVASALAANGQGAEALQVLSAGLAKNAGLPSMVSQALDLEMALGDFDAALARVNAMQKTAPRPEMWMARRASLLARAGRRDESRAAWLALRDRLAALPNLERGSPFFHTLAEQAGQALASR